MATAAVELPSVARNRAFENLYRRYAKDVYHYALAILRNPTDAEDVTQTTFLNAYRAIQRGEEPIKPQNWLIKIAHNAARTRYQRATRRVKEVPLDDHLDQLAIADEDKPDVEAVLEALGRLPLNQRAALVMRELEGRTYAEIADTLEVSVAAVETLIFRARRALRLKASSIRVLSVVPLPTSLLRLLEGGGGIAAGSSSVVGYGLIFKAAVAVVAGVVATGVSGDHTRSAQAARRAGTPITASTVSNTAGRALAGAVTRHARTAAQVASLLPVARPEDRHVDVAGAALATRTEAPAHAATTSALPSAVSQATVTVTSVVSSAVAATPSLPVAQLPSVPSVPQVHLPPTPPPPPLP